MTTEESRRESIGEFGVLLTRGMSMGFAWLGLRPLLDGSLDVANDNVIGHTAIIAFPFVDGIPWSLVGIAICASVLLWYHTKRVPKVVAMYANREGVMEDTHREDISREDGAT